MKPGTENLSTENPSTEIEGVLMAVPLALQTTTRGVAMSDDTDADAKRVYWHSRRGMLELDLVLMPYAENQYPLLNETEKLIYKKLLTSEDQDLFAWFLKRQVPDDEELVGAVTRILDYAKSNQG